MCIYHVDIGSTEHGHNGIITDIAFTKPNEQGTIKEIWKCDIEMEKWFGLTFQEFVDKELIPMSKN